MTKSVSILGCGPAGLMVAHAANLAGWNFRIYSKVQKSPLHGAQYLHKEIPGLPCGPEICVTYELRGTPESYRHKVYGPSWDGTVSPEDLQESHSAWDLRSAYEELWFKYGGEVDNTYFPRGMNVFAAHVAVGHDLIVSTIPRTTFDDNDDNFKRSYIWALGDGDYQRVHMHRPDPYTVVCDGTNENQWYRVSNIFGYCTMEWPQWYNVKDGHQFASVTPPARGAALVAKPLEYTGNAAKEITHIGRYAKWQKGYLTSDAFFEAMEIFTNDSI